MSTSLKDDVMKAVNSTAYATETKGTWGNYGWICPKCGAVMAPFVSICVNCRGNYNSEITTNTSTEFEKSLQKELWKYSGTGTAPEAHYGTTYAEAHVAERKLN